MLAIKRNNVFDATDLYDSQFSSQNLQTVQIFLHRISLSSKGISTAVMLPGLEGRDTPQCLLCEDENVSGKTRDGIYL